jgi:hypothetical protein
MDVADGAHEEGDVHLDILTLELEGPPPEKMRWPSKKHWKSAWRVASPSSLGAHPAMTVSWRLG